MNVNRSDTKLTNGFNVHLSELGVELIWLFEHDRFDCFEPRSPIGKCFWTISPFGIIETNLVRDGDKFDQDLRSIGQVARRWNGNTPIIYDGTDTDPLEFLESCFANFRLAILASMQLKTKGDINQNLSTERQT